MFVFVSQWPGAAEPASGAAREFLAALPGAEEARSWLAAQRDALVVGTASTAMIRARLASWRAIGEDLARSGGLMDARRGYVIYPPRVTLALFLFDRAEGMYAAALGGSAAAAIPTVDESFRLGGVVLTPAPADKHPAVRRVRAALDSLALPANVFRGYRVFLLPFAMGDVSGQGGPGFTFLAAEPQGEKFIPNQLEVTLAHEFGHYLHLAGMPRETRAGRARWQTYLDLRGIAWREDGRVKTEDWARSPEETFAEDFRLLFGGEQAARESPATLAGDPRQDPDAALRLKGFMTDLAAGTKPDPSREPWPESGDGASRPIGIQLGGLAGLLLLLGGLSVLAGQTVKMARRGGGPPLPG